MEIRASVFIATSLDGFIARENGDLDWLTGDSGSESEGGEDYGYQDHWAAIDTLVLGRHSFETVLGFGQWPYAGKRVVVLSSRQFAIPEELQGKIEVFGGPAQEVAEALANSGSKHLYVDGGKTIQAFLRAGLIQELIITVIPVLIGEGIPLFGPLEKDIKLELLQSQTYESGFVQHRYRVID
jgi:dihydrofolate reductase